MAAEGGCPIGLSFGDTKPNNNANLYSLRKPPPIAKLLSRLGSYSEIHKVNNVLIQK
jgi:hypothetical protein